MLVESILSLHPILFTTSDLRVEVITNRQMLIPLITDAEIAQTSHYILCGVFSDNQLANSLANKAVKGMIVSKQVLGFTFRALGFVII